MDITFTLDSTITASTGTVTYGGITYNKTSSFSISPTPDASGYIEIPNTTTSIDFTANAATGGTNPTLEAFYDASGNLADSVANSTDSNTMNVTLSNVTGNNTESFALLIKDSSNKYWALDPQMKVNT